MRSELPDIITEIKSLNLPVKLDTNGMFPLMLEKLLKYKKTCPDYIALDLKIAPARYGELMGTGDALIQSAALIRESGIEHEFRTLVLPNDFITEKDIEALAPLVGNALWYLRPFRAGTCLDPAWNEREEPAEKSNARAEALAAKARELGKNGVSTA